MVWLLVAVVVVVIALGEVLRTPLFLRDARLLRADREPEPEPQREEEAA